jgi:hypothetical protein
MKSRRRIARRLRPLTLGVAACAALAAPAAAEPGADYPPAQDPPAAYSGPTVAGDTKSDLNVSQGPLAAYGGPTVAGDTKSDLKISQSYADKVGSLRPKELAAAYGTTKIDAKPVATPGAAVASSDDGTNGWRIAAVAEAGLLAAIALGTAALIGRARPRRHAAA